MIPLKKIKVSPKTRNIDNIILGAVCSGSLRHITNVTRSTISVSIHIPIGLPRRYPFERTLDGICMFELIKILSVVVSCHAPESMWLPIFLRLRHHLKAVGLRSQAIENVFYLCL